MANKPPDVWRVVLTVPTAATPALETAFEIAFDEDLLALSHFEATQPPVFDWRFEALLSAPPSEEQLTMLAQAGGVPRAAIEAGLLQKEDWVAQSHGLNPPVQAGRFYVRGSHVTDPVPGGSWALLIDGTTAFGTGQHESTKGCLTALDRLVRSHKARRLMDLGCGTGILALAMARALRRPVLATDIDPEAVRVTDENRRRNQLTREIRAVTAPNLRHRVIASRKPYDLVTANILAAPLRKLAHGLARHVAPGGYVVLSGILAGQAAGVTTAYRQAGFRLVSRLADGDWRTLIVRR